MRIFLIIYLAASFVIAVLTSLFVISSFVIEAMIFYFLCVSIYLVKIAYSLLVIDSLYKDFKQKYEDDKADKRMTVNYYGGPVPCFKVDKEKQILWKFYVNYTDNIYGWEVAIQFQKNLQQNKLKTPRRIMVW